MIRIQHKLIVPFNAPRSAQAKKRTPTLEANGRLYQLSKRISIILNVGYDFFFLVETSLNIPE